MNERQAGMAKVAQMNVRAGARIVAATAQANAPVLGDKSAITIRAWNKAVKAAGRPGAGPTVGPGSRPVRGLLKASIKPSKKLKFDGEAWSAKVGPRGGRVHLYGKKQENRYHYMEAGYRDVSKQMTAIAQASYDKVWKE